MKTLFFVFAFTLLFLNFNATEDRWQQRVEYVMDIDMDTEKHQYNGEMSLTYYNNSPDELDRLFFHLYFNAFQPGSMMDVRSRTIEDPDSKPGDKIAALSDDEIGWIRVSSVKVNGKKVDFSEVGTILEVDLAKSISSGSKTKIEMEWSAQVPKQIRRSGYMNLEGVEFSMAQWYPKMCEYDYEGWHANPYIAREFHGVWGDFEVNINIDSSYLLGGTGVVQNGNEVGWGYASDEEPREATDRLTWKFKAENVHDFVWAADPDFHHDSRTLEDGTVLHFIYQHTEEYQNAWTEMQDLFVEGFMYLNERFGEYPYPQYSIIQAGDGGMEYPMATLVTGHRNLRSLVGVSIHEAAHSWYQGVLATNESLYEWMDEGFTSFATAETMNKLFPNPQYTPHGQAYQSYYSVVRDGKEEPLITHADHYSTNYSYWVGAYSKGEVFMEQLGYVIGAEKRDQVLREYYETWKFKHPNPTDLKRIAEKISGIELDWYFQYFVNSIKNIDYGITQVLGQDGKTHVTIDRIGQMPMPLDIEIKYRDGTSSAVYIPLRIMRGEKENESGLDRVVEEDWPWTHPNYELTIDRQITEIEAIIINPDKRMADIDRSNNTFELLPGTEFIWKH